MADREHDQLLATAADRFERRLSEEIGDLRVTMIEQDTATRQSVAKDIADLRGEMIEQDAATRLSVAKDIADLRVEMSDRFADARVRTEAQHRELIKWAFVFWVGQAAAVAGIVSALT